MLVSRLAPVGSRLLGAGEVLGVRHGLTAAWGESTTAAAAFVPRGETAEYAAAINPVKLPGPHRHRPTRC